MLFSRKRHLQVILALAAILLLVGSPAHAAGVMAKLDRNSAVVGETVTLVLETDDTNQSLDTDFSVLNADFDILNRRSETQMSFVNGAQTASVRLVITLEPKHEGALPIPAMKFPGGVSSNPLVLKVTAAPALAPGEAEPVFIEVSVEPDTGPYYVLSQISLTVRIFYQANLTEAAINPPSPAQASVRLLDEIPYQSDRNGERYRVLERRYAIFPERSGALTVPPMQLSGRLIERPSDRLWQPTVRGRRVQVESEPVTLEISPKPASYTGDFWLPARRITISQQISDNENLHVGEPITRTVIVDAVGLEENMLEEPVWPEMDEARIYPDQPQGISRDDGEWVLGHKEFRYAIVPEQAGDLRLPALRLDWWDTVRNEQRTEMLPGHTVKVLPSELNTSVSVPPQGVADTPAAVPGAPGRITPVDGSAMLWKSGTAVFAALWLLTLVLYFRRSASSAAPAVQEGYSSPAEKELLKDIQQACQANNASSARSSLAQWIRNYAPRPLRGSMRDFGAACRDAVLQASIAELDACGFNDKAAGEWKGEALWRDFKRWRAASEKPQTTEVSDKPDLYAG
jgi:hypothetical protein